MGSPYGEYRITTQVSQHRWLRTPGEVYWQRLPGEGRARFGHGEDEPVTVTRIETWPALGCVPYIVFDDPDDPAYSEQWRQSSLIKTIELVEVYAVAAD